MAAGYRLSAVHGHSSPGVQNDELRREGKNVTSRFPLRGIPAKRERVYEGKQRNDTLC